MRSATPAVDELSSSPISIGLPFRPGSGLRRKYSRMWTASSPIASGLRALLAIAIVRSRSSGGSAAAATQACATWSTGTMSIRFEARPGRWVRPRAA